MTRELHRQAVAHYNRGCSLQRLGEWEAAICAYDEALALDPKLAPAHSNRGAAFAAMNRCDDALASLDRAIELEPDYPEAHFTRAVTLLLKGELIEGWTEFEWRWKTAPGRTLRRAKSFTQPLWLGEQTIAGKSVLLYCERGLGDTLQFCRYAQMVSQLQARVVLQVQAPLVELLRRLEGPSAVVSETEPLPAFDLQCPLLSLPLVFETSLKSIPAAAKYLRADAAQVAVLRSRRGKPNAPHLEAPGPAPRVAPASVGADVFSADLFGADVATARIGVVWRGDANNPDDRNRSIPLSELMPFLPEGLHYVSLQKDITSEERTLIDAGPNFSVVGRLSDFDETAALCECLDLVVAVDTSVAHLAAALGRTTWILLPFNPDCRWLLGREDSPWYPSVKLYRQLRSGDWRAVLARIQSDLERLRCRSESVR